MLKLGQNYDLLCNMIIRPPRFVYGIFYSNNCKAFYLLFNFFFSFCVAFYVGGIFLIYSFSFSWLFVVRNWHIKEIADLGPRYEHKGFINFKYLWICRYFVAGGKPAQRTGRHYFICLYILMKVNKHNFF